MGSLGGEHFLVSFGGYNGRYTNEVEEHTSKFYLKCPTYFFPHSCSFNWYQVNVLKPSHKSTLQSKMMETPVPDSVSAVHYATEPIRDIESVGQEGKIREIAVDNGDSEPMVLHLNLFLVPIV